MFNIFRRKKKVSIWLTCIELLKHMDSSKAMASPTERDNLVSDSIVGEKETCSSAAAIS